MKINEEISKWKDYYTNLYWVLPHAPIFGVSSELRSKANRYVNTQVLDEFIAHISTEDCIDCGLQADDYHHYKGYESKFWADIVPMCSACHNALHMKFRTNVWFQFGTKYSLLKYYNDGITEYTTLIKLLGTTKNSLLALNSDSHLGLSFTSNHTKDIEDIHIRNANIIALHETDSSLTQASIGDMFGISFRRVSEILLSAGVTTRNLSSSGITIEQLVEEKHNDMSLTLTKLGDIFGINYTTVSEKYKKCGYDWKTNTKIPNKLCVDDSTILCDAIELLYDDQSITQRQMANYLDIGYTSLQYEVKKYGFLWKDIKKLAM